jgi:predicted tellurium resistance membrane protein TerC
MWRELREAHAAPQGLTATGHHVAFDATPAAPRKTVAQAIWQIVVADVSMSLDNVLAVAGAARSYPYILIFGLVLSIGLMGLAATFVARLLQKRRWIAYVGLAIILYVALDMCYRGTREVWPYAERLASLL